MKADDAINRQAAINVAVDAVDDWDGGCNKTREEYIRKALETLPPVTAEKPNKWIPVSERLPEIRQNVLCQCRANSYSVLRLNHDGDWECIYPHTTYMQSFVIAWMPLPELYKAESEAKNESI